jgi:NAD(P)H-nitrite reductase large subunit
MRYVRYGLPLWGAETGSSGPEADYEVRYVRFPGSRPDVRRKMPYGSDTIGGGELMRWVIIGASAAGLNAAAVLRDRDPNGEITLISEDTRLYSRCILHYYISGERDPGELAFLGQDFMEKNRIRWRGGTRVIGLDRQAKQAILENGAYERYDKLLIASGGSTAFPPVKGLKEAKSGVYGLRTFEDAERIKAAASQAAHSAVLGAGLVGIDALAGLLPFKGSLTLVEAQDRILPLQLDQRAAGVYQRAFADRGVRQRYGEKVLEARLDDQGAVKGLFLSSGETIPCDMLICATGVRANVDFLRDSGLECDPFGLCFDSQGRTSDSSVFGAGDVSGRTPIWSAAVKEGIIAATNMTGGSAERTAFFASKTTMYFLGIRSMSLGIPGPPDDSYQVEISDEGADYKKIIHKEGRIYGAIIQGDLSYCGILTQLIQEKVNISKVKKPLYRIDYSDFFTMTDTLEFRYPEETRFPEP